MWRAVASVVAGIVAWGVIVTVLNFGLRATIPGYHAAEATLQFTISMKLGRLVEAALTSIATGVIVGMIAPEKKWPPLAAGLIILALFLPEHVKLWGRFPIWYHLSFLVPLVPLVALGGWLGRRKPVDGGRLATVS